MPRSKRQVRLAFNPLPTSSPAASTANKEHGQRSYAHVGYEGSQNKRRRVVEDHEDNENANLPTPLHSSSKQQPAVFPESDSDEPILPSSVRRQRKNTRQGKLDFSNHLGIQFDDSDKNKSEDSDSSLEELHISSMRTKVPGRLARSQTGIFSSQVPGRRHDLGDDDDTEDVSLPPGTTSTKKGTKRQTRSSRSSTRRTRATASANEDHDVHTDSRSATREQRGSIIQNPFAESESSGDDAPELYSSPKKRRTSNHVPSKVYDDFVDDEDEDHEQEGEEEEEEEEEEAPMRTRRLRRGHRKLTDQEQEDLDEDLEFLRSSPPAEKTFAMPRKTNARLEALQALKRKRASRDEGGPTSSAAQDLPVEVISDEDEDSDGYNELEASNDRNDGLSGPEDEDDFVVEDEDDPLGAPADVDVEMPLWATGFARMKPKQLFVYAVEWMVQRKLNPAYDQEKEKYHISFQKLNDEVQGLAGSKFKSAAWTRDFLISLQARPEIEIHEIDGLRGDLELDKCEACNRSGHPATFRIHFHGRPYNPRTLEPVEQDDDLDSEEDDADSDASAASHEIYDHQGRQVPSSSRTFDVGRFCKDNAMTAHALEHWKFQLNQWVVEWLEAEGHLSNSKIVRRDRWDEPRRRKYAKKVIEEMVEIGQVTTLYKQFREEIDMARETKSGWQARHEREY